MADRSAPGATQYRVWLAAPSTRQPPGGPAQGSHWVALRPAEEEAMSGAAAAAYASCGELVSVV